MRNQVTSWNQQAIAFQTITRDIPNNWLHMFHRIIPIRPCRTIPSIAIHTFNTKKGKNQYSYGTMRA